MTSSQESFAQRLKRLRHKKKLTMKVVAERIGVPMTTYREWEYGRAIKGIDVLPRLAEVFEVPLTELILGPSNNKNSIMKELDELESALLSLRRKLMLSL